MDRMFAIHRGAGCAAVLLLVATALPALAQSLSDTAPRLSASQRQALSEAARDRGVASWQREFMLGLARGAGGGSSTSSPDGVWESVVGIPPAARQSHSAIFDPARNQMVIFGGDRADGINNEVWELSLTDPPVWYALQPAGTPPSPRSSHSAIYDPVRSRMLVFGGADNSTNSGLLATSMTCGRYRLGSQPRGRS